MVVDPVLGEAVELIGAELDRRLVVADVALEGLAQLGEALVELADAVADRGVAVDPRTTEVAQGEVADPLGVVVEAGDARLGVVDDHQVVDLAVEREVGQQLGRLDLRLLGLLADGGVGVDLLEQAGGRHGVAQSEGDLVPAIEQVGGPARTVGLDGGDEVADDGQLVGRAAGEPGRPGVGAGVGGGHGERCEVGHAPDATGGVGSDASAFRYRSDNAESSYADSA